MPPAEHVFHKFVLGFVLSADRKRVLLVNKQPKEGRLITGVWNGIGGRVLPGQTCADAMIDHGRKYTGFDYDNPCWLSFGEILGEDYMVMLYSVRDADMSFEPYREVQSDKFKVVGLQDVVNGYIDEAEPLAAHLQTIAQWLQRRGPGKRLTIRTR